MSIPYVSEGDRLTPANVNAWLNRAGGERVIHPTIPYDRETKAYQYVDANTYYGFVPNPSSGYSLIVFKNNVTTAASSLASTSSDVTPYRMTSLLDAVEVMVGHKTIASSNGTWSSANLATDIPTHDAGVYYTYHQSTTIGAWIEFTVTIPKDGYFNVGLLMGASASSDITISVDGSAIDANFSINNAGGAKQWIKEYTTKPGERTIRITNNTAGSTGLNVIGVNVFSLKNARDDLSYDTLGYYRNTSRIQPVESNSANDYAIRKASDGIYGGSYHGGETSIVNKILVDKEETLLSSGFVVTKNLELESSSTIAWEDGSNLAVTMRHVFHLGGYTVSVQLNGSVVADQIFTTLIGLNEDYTHVDAPKSISISSIPNGTRQELGKDNSVELSYNATKQSVKITHTAFFNEESDIDGNFLWRVVGTYNKYYVTPIWSLTNEANTRTITDLYARTTVQVT